MTTENQYSIYILMSYTGTSLSRLVKFFTNKPYTHVSIALDPELTNLYSFGRKKLHLPFIAGFIKEDIHDGIYSIYNNTTCQVQKIDITKRQYQSVCQNITFFEQKKYTSYNFLGLFGVLFKRPIIHRNTYFCSEFVATVLLNANIHLVHKNPALVEPSDFLQCEKSTLFYKGHLNQFTPYSA